jgi:uncharacterized membrane protein
MLRFVLYGLVGWCAEIVWTASYDTVAGETRAAGDTVARRKLSRAERLRLTGRTYLWMLPIYGLAAFLFEPVHDRLRPLPWAARGVVYMAGCFAVEYAAGWLLRRTTGRCPWDYSYARASVHGYIRLDYAPVWFAFGMLLERVHDTIVAIEPPLRSALGL